MKPICLVVLPGMGDAEEVYAKLVLPAVHEAGMEPVVGVGLGERLTLAECAVVDVTAASGELWFALGARHAVRPGKTVLLAAQNAATRVGPEAVRYPPEAPEMMLAILLGKLKAARARAAGKAICSVLEDCGGLGRRSTGRFRELVEYDAEWKNRLRKARASENPKAALQALQEGLDVATEDYGVLVDLMLSYQAVEAWEETIDLVGRMPVELGRTTLVQEQLAMALSRVGDWERAEMICREAVAGKGAWTGVEPVLGRVYQDRWEVTGEQEWLDRAIGAYLAGFEADWRDAIAGVMALILMELREPPDERRKELAPLVRYAVRRRIKGTDPDCRDWAAALALALLAGDAGEAEEAMAKIFEGASEVWEIRPALEPVGWALRVRRQRGEVADWMEPIAARLGPRVG